MAQLSDDGMAVAWTCLHGAAKMQIPSFTTYPLTPNASLATGSGSTASSGSAGSASQDNSIVQEFLNYAKMSPIDRLRANIMKSMGLTQQDLDKMTPAQQQAVEQKIEQLIQQELQKNADKTGQVVNVSA